MTDQHTPPSRERITPPPAQPFTSLADTVRDDNRDEILRNGPIQHIDDAPPARRPKRWRLVLAGAAVIVLVAAAVLVTLLVTRPKQQPTPAAPPAPFTVTGAIVVPADILSSGQAVGESCATDDGYGDIQAGAQVTVKDAAGTVVAVGRLQAGTVADLYGEGDMPALLGYASKCTFAFNVTNVPAGQQIYSVEVSHRGELRYDRDQLDQPLALTLG